MRGAIGERVVSLGYVAIRRACGGRTAAKILVEEIPTDGCLAHDEQGLDSCCCNARIVDVVSRRVFPLSLRLVSSRGGSREVEVESIVIREWTDSPVVSSSGSSSDREWLPMTWL